MSIKIVTVLLFTALICSNFAQKLADSQIDESQLEDRLSKLFATNAIVILSDDYPADQVSFSF